MFSANHNIQKEGSFMKHFSLKTKLTALYAILMTAVVCLILAFLFSFSSKEILTGVGRQLEERVADSMDDIRFDGEYLEVDSDFLELENGIYLSLYASDGSLLYGTIPYGFDNSLPFENGNIRKVKNGDTQYYVLDLIYEISGYGMVDIRGISSITAAEKSFIMTVRLSLILLPLIVVITAILGYFMTKRTLRPVDQITRTVQTIQIDNDLSRRVSLGNGNDEIYRLSSTFDCMLAQIENSMVRERQFTSDVAHELRTPLSTMTLICDNLLSDDHLEASVREDLLLLQKKIHGLSHMVSQLLMLSRADQGRARLEPEPLDLSEIALIACEEAKELASSKHISVEYDLESELSMVGDETLLIRFFMNLLNNAICYGKENGHIWLTLQRDAYNTHYIKGSVKDDGIGINEKDLPHIWERFYQADASRTESENSGLGLSMVDWIVKAHHGTIQVKSKLGEGSEFFFSFPCDKEHINTV